MLRSPSAVFPLILVIVLLHGWLGRRFVRRCLVLAIVLCAIRRVGFGTISVISFGRFVCRCRILFGIAIGAFGFPGLLVPQGPFSLRFLGQFQLDLRVDLIRYLAGIKETIHRRQKLFKRDVGASAPMMDFRFLDLSALIKFWSNVCKPADDLNVLISCSACG
ncbi:hypothetical protein Trco_003010 [Trichoderma cornu-damae]|uniref:Uncharacterized protein n=1 Tax=Trichoderma cornu-damae TaxID=654480 RepID=A0A9P8TYC0_9HYPO|nr:hypothetical protein Trco_003010 [Trichoderma cornu-damae]